MTVEQLIELVAHMVRALGAVAIDFINTLSNLLMLNSNQKSIYFQTVFNAYKSASSRLIKKEYPNIRTKLYKEAFWSQSFCLISTGGANIETIKKYIESQGEK